MTLAVGARLGPYEILAPLGAGGMGEVYRARDTKLGREVALKIVPDSFTHDPERVARFRREAQVLASLNHPHIAQIHGLDEANGTQFLVLELVDGESLDKRIKRGPLPVDEALPIAKQIAEALEAAHEKGIIHRDLKPANIALTKDDQVKVLDFGLAKAVEQTIASGDLENSPTITSPAMMTGVGVILGTAAYMSPEQAKGRPADKRTDIWAFGCVLYETLTGTRAFDGGDVSTVLARILEREPNFNALPSSTPAAIRRLLRRSLEKDRNRRLADIADARLELDERGSDAPVSGAPGARGSTIRASLRSGLIGLTVGVLLATTLWLAVFAIRNRPAIDTEVYRSSILLPGRLGSPRTLASSVALSPDGRRLAFVANDTTGRSQLWIRSLDGVAAQPLADTASATAPFWSPSSRWVAFVQNGQLKKVEATGGQVLTLCDAAPFGGTWNRDDLILFTQPNGSLAVVRAVGGTPTTVIDAKTVGATNASPSFLPDGRHFVYRELSQGLEQAQAYIGSLDASERTPLRLEANFVQYTAGFLWSLQGGTLMAQPFDSERRIAVGEAVPVAEQVRREGVWLSGAFSVSSTGTLVYQADPSPGWELTWFDRMGRPSGKLGPPAAYASPRLSPDDRRLLVDAPRADATGRDPWIFDLARGLRTRFSVDDLRLTRGGIWSPDGRWIVFASDRKGSVILVQRASNGAGDPTVLLEDEFDKELLDWSPDGRFILYQRRGSAGEAIPWVLSLDRDRKTFPLSQARAFGPRFSPDGRWIVYVSSESGRGEVFVTPFPGPGGRQQISTAGGIDARWRSDGKEILYLASGQLMSAAITLGHDRLAVGEVKPLFDLPRVGPRGTYDVSSDGDRILAVTEQTKAGTEPLTLVVNWPALLKK